MSHKFSLVIPCYNEEKGLPDLVARCKEVVAKVDAEIILVDNGSQDNTAKLLQDLTLNISNIKVKTVAENIGYGAGILVGLRATTSDIIGWTHADMQTDPMDAIQAFKFFNNTKKDKNLFIKGRRFGRPITDRFFTLGMGIFETILLRHALIDVNAQPTLFHRDFWNKWHSPPKDFSLDLYGYAMAKKYGLDVKRFPVNFSERKHGQSSWNINWAGKYNFIKRTLNYSFRLRKQFKTSNKN
jgi:glycosyltransferase involved in cell wall biosynthesis